ncbi:GreA/GreB family elongation factor [Ramlibacter sp.]|uniref:GreA/GreB family elongation factor n=1 Tax=Ramlibacter sp. TaxID=1917967 RepID=UPI003D1050E7
MSTPHPVERKLTQLDFIRLKKFVRSGEAPVLEDLICDADVVPGDTIPPEVVTMYSQFVIRDLTLNRRQVMVLCYPADAEPAKGYVSVLSPAGLGLIGLPVGAIARWASPGGEETVAQIEQILFQPEATGDYVT